MDKPYELPVQDDLGFCNVLFCALGGDGANMAGKLLFKFGCGDLGLDGGYDAAYGSEKKGTVTDVSVRFCPVGAPVRHSGPTDRPDFLVVFHDDLIEPLGLGRGLSAGATCIANTTRPPAEIRRMLRLPIGRVVCVDGTRIAFEAGSRLNMPMLAVLCRELGFPVERIERQIVQQWPRAAEANIRAFTMALSTCRSRLFETDGEYGARDAAGKRGPIGWCNMLNGGTIDALTHCTTGRDNRIAGRGRVPRFNAAACNSCGICLTVCSDPGGLLWREGRMQGIDPTFCKGCMRCVEVCPQTKKGQALEWPEGVT